MDETKKALKVFFRRVSTATQTLEMQIKADEKFRKNLCDDEYIEVNELAVSANKLKLRERKEIMQVIKLIRSGVVEKLYVYDRSRLTHNFYEYMELVDLFIENDVQVIFTSTESSYMNFSNNIFAEGFNGILIEEEGQSIARRVSDSHRKHPPKKFGYKATKDEVGRKKYNLIPSKRELLEEMFNECQHINTLDDFEEYINHYAKLLKKTQSDIVRMITSPFYCAHESVGHIFSPLPHVEPVIGSEKFKEVQLRLAPFIKKIELEREKRVHENVFTPKCGICKKEMIYRSNYFGKAGKYTCSNQHPKNIINVDYYNDILKKYIAKVLKNLDEEKIKRAAIVRLNQIINQLRLEDKKKANKINQLEMDIALMDYQSLTSNTFSTKLQRLKNLKAEKKSMQDDIIRCDNYKTDLKSLIKCIEKKVIEIDVFQLSNILIKQIEVFENSISIDFYFSEYINTLELEGLIVNE